MTGPTTTEDARERTVMERPAEVADAHRLDPAQVAASLDVDPAAGLNSGQAAERLVAYGPNRLAEPARRPEWLKFLDQFRNWLIGILLIAAVVAAARGPRDPAHPADVRLQLGARHRRRRRHAAAPNFAAKATNRASLDEPVQAPWAPWAKKAVDEFFVPVTTGRLRFPAGLDAVRLARTK